MGQEFTLVSVDAQVALTEFSQDFAMALAQGNTEPWARAQGLYRASRALKATYPVPVSAAGYKEFKGDMKYRSLFEKSLSLVPKTWQDGVAELASIIEAPDFTGFAEQPAAMAAAAVSLGNEIIAGLIEANPTCWDDLAFFHSSHNYNVFDASVGTFSNDFTGAGTDPTLANLKLAKERFRKVKNAAGKPLGLRMTHVLVPGAQEETWKDMLEQDMVIQTIGDNFGAVDNRQKGTVTLVVSDELTDDNKWYPLALNKPGMFPWVVQDEGAPEEMISDKTSHLYQTSLKVGIAYILRGNGALALPHCMQRWAGTAPS